MCPPVLQWSSTSNQNNNDNDEDDIVDEEEDGCPDQEEEKVAHKTNKKQNNKNNINTIQVLPSFCVGFFFFCKIFYGLFLFWFSWLWKWRNNQVEKRWKWKNIFKFLSNPSRLLFKSFNAIFIIFNKNKKCHNCHQLVYITNCKTEGHSQPPVYEQSYFHRPVATSTEISHYQTLPFYYNFLSAFNYFCYIIFCYKNCTINPHPHRRKQRHHHHHYHHQNNLLVLCKYLCCLTALFLFSWTSVAECGGPSGGSAKNSPKQQYGLQQSEIKIGALFTEDEKDGPSELAFKYAVYRINKDRTLLINTTLVYDIQYVPKEDSFHASKKACGQLSNGISAIFGPQDPLLGGHIQSLCDALDIPHVEARLDLETELKEFSINLYPSPAIIGQALRELIIYLNWTKIAVIYEDDVSLIKLQQLVRPPLSKQVQFIFRKGNAMSFRDVLLDVRSRGVYSLIIDTRPESLPKILAAILQTQMNNYKYHYHFVTFDIEIYDLENFRYNFVNLTAFRMVDSEHPSVKQILRDMEKFQPKGQPILNRTNVIRFEPALIFDSVYVFARGLQSLERGATLRPVNVSCDDETPWSDGSSLFNYVNLADLRGLTGRITFKEGRRNTVKLDLIKLRQTDLEKIGEWSTTSGLNITNHGAFHDFGTTNITLRVTTILSQPYVQKRNGPFPSNHSNDQLEGFCIDLLKAIAEMLNFQYELYLVPDGKYGAENTTTGEWNGLVREIIDKNADLAVASMTINYARESVIHFTKPYMNLGIGILFKLPSTMPTRLFSFMSPLDVDIWLYVLAAYILVSLTMFIVARFSPNEWRSQHPCVAAAGGVDTQEMENQFSMANSFWFTIVTLMHQGCDLNPKAASTRIIGAIWWFFTLILVSSYTANLAAFLTVERMITPIESVEDLATQSKIAYGTLESGSTMTFFRDSQIETYQKMWRFMENRPSVFVKTYDEGVQRVIEGNYAFLMESTMLDFKVQRNCNLTQIGGLLDSKGYGIATPIGSPWRDKISLAILHLQEKGIIRMLYDRWWKRPGITCSRDDKSKEGKANALGVENIGGVFVVLLGGLAVAIVTAIVEFCINSKKNAQNLRQSLCTEMSDELRIAVKCHESRQRTALKRKCSKCVINKLVYDDDPGGGGGTGDGGADGGNAGGVTCNNHHHQRHHNSSFYIDNTYVPGLPEPINELYQSSRSRHPIDYSQHSDATNPNGVGNNRFAPNILSTLIRRRNNHRSSKHGPWSTANSSRVLSSQSTDAHQSQPPQQQQQQQQYPLFTSCPYESDIEMIHGEVDGRSRSVGGVGPTNGVDDDDDDDDGIEALSSGNANNSNNALPAPPPPPNETRSSNELLGTRSVSSLGYNRSVVDVECYRDRCGGGGGAVSSNRQYVDHMTTPTPPPPPAVTPGLHNGGLLVVENNNNNTNTSKMKEMLMSQRDGVHLHHQQQPLQSGKMTLVSSDSHNGPQQYNCLNT